MKKVLDFLYALAFLIIFLFIGSGMLEALVFGILERMGL